MILEAQQLMSLLTGWMWVFCRIAAMVSIMPVLGSTMIPMRIRLLTALAVTVVAVPVLPLPSAIDPISLDGALLTLQQILIGWMMGFVLAILMGVFMYAGQLVAMQAGLGFAAMLDHQGGVQVPILGQFYVMVATLLFLSLNGHLYAVELVVNSFALLPVTTSGFPVDSYQVLLQWAGVLFSGAVQVALPAIVALMLVNTGFAVISRSSPALNIFVIGFPVTILAGFAAVLFTLDSLPADFARLYEQVPGVITRLLGGA